MATPLRYEEPRVAIAGFVHESNSFAPSPADMAAFLKGGGYLPLARGEAILECARVNLPVSGAGESAPVTAECYDAITQEILDGLRKAGPLDGVFLDLHGAMVAENAPDGEGVLLARVREVVGPDVPVVAALDLHGNITQAMVDHADCLVGFRTYPHVDMAETGRRAAAELDRLMKGGPNAKAFRQLDFLIPIAWQSTLGEPGGRLYRAASEDKDGLFTASLFMGFPAADFADCGPSVIAYAATQELADAVADRVANSVADAESEFAGRAYEPIEGVREAMRLAQTASKPVLIADTQDNPGAGGDSDTTGILRALVECNAQRAAIGLIRDAAAAKAAHEAGVGAVLDLELGGKSGIPGDAPFRGKFNVEEISNG